MKPIQSMAIGLSVFVCANIAGVHALGQPGQAHDAVARLFQFDGETPLFASTTRLFYLHRDDGPENATSAEFREAFERRVGTRAAPDHARFGVAREKITARPRYTLWEVDLSERAMTADGVMALVRHIATDPETAFVTPLFETEKGSPVLVRPYIIAVPMEGVSDEGFTALVSDMGVGTIVERDYMGLPNHFLIDATARTGMALCEDAGRLFRHPKVKMAEPDTFIRLERALVPNDTGFGLQWHLRNDGFNGEVAGVDINVTPAWDITLGQGALVLVIDDGIQLDHPDLNINPIASTDFANEANDGGPQTPQDIHGTAVAGVIASQIDGVGTVGVAPGAFVASARFEFGAPLLEQSTQKAKAIRHAVDIHARIINASWGTFAEPSVIDLAITDAWEMGVIMFAAAGNNGPGIGLLFPATHFRTVAVGALQSDGLITIFSQTGFDLDLVAPGKNIFTTDRTGIDGYNDSVGNINYTIDPDFNGVDGTSFATPCAAGVAALLLAKNRNLTPTQIRQIMRDTAVDINPQLYGNGFDEFTGHGLINAAAALDAVPPFVEGDLNTDSFVDGSDLGILLGLWGQQSLQADLTGDGFVDGADLGILLGNWTP